MIDSTLIVYILAFSATAAAVVAFWNTFVEAAAAQAERKDATRASELQLQEFHNPMERFVKPGRLFRLRLIFALTPAAIVLGILILAKFTHPAALIVAPAIFLVAGSFLPVFYFKGKVRKRQLDFETSLLDLTIGIGNALRAGMALPQAIEKVGEQFKGAMREELLIVLREYRLGVDLVKALDRMATRMPCEDMKLLVSAIKLTTDSGGSLASVLTEMTAMIRGRREFADKVKALTAEGRFEAIAMACAPVAAFIFLHLIQAELMRPLYTTGVGWITIGVVVALEVAGYFTIRKIVSVEV
ncbi:MAG: type II secretion system F family protein [Kiritimatiellae bacterium]|nr:type II secretion system F family protein [Kiritimatiellia bacterium]